MVTSISHFSSELCIFKKSTVLFSELTGLVFKKQMTVIHVPNEIRVFCLHY
jgi:hypothetical protein